MLAALAGRIYHDAPQQNAFPLAGVTGVVARDKFPLEDRVKVRLTTFTQVAPGIAVATSMGTTAGAQTAARFDACARGGPLTSNGIGPLKIGLTPDSLRKVCRIAAERRLAPEYPITQFTIAVGSDTLLAYEEAGRLYWIEVRSKAFRTVDSLGVGSPLGRLLDLEGLDGGVGDGDDQYELSALRSPVCGLVFWVDSKTATAISAIAPRSLGLVDARPTGAVMDTLRSRARTGTISRIDVRGCL